MAQTERICPQCDNQIAPTANACAVCGASTPFSLAAEPRSFQVNLHPPATIIEGLDAATGDKRIIVNSPGAKSETRLTDVGEMSVSVEGIEAGRKSEPWAVKTLCTKLKHSGLAVSRLAGEDHRGEDALLKVGETTYVLQLITTPNAQDFWREAHAASAMTQATIEQAIGWLRDAIEMKVQTIPPAQRRAMVLVVDVRHAGLLAQEQVTELYVARFGPPAREHGFSSVWVVGPTAKYCVRLGEGNP